MLKSIKIENFKAFGDAQDVPLGPITLIYGPNSAGKSSILQSLLLLRQSLLSSSLSLVEDRIIFSGEFVDLGNYIAALYKHDTSKKMTIGVSFDTPRHSQTLPGIRLPRGVQRTVNMHIGLTAEAKKEKSNDAWLTEIEYCLNERIHVNASLTRIPTKKSSESVIDEVYAPSFRVKDVRSARSLALMASFMAEIRMQGREPSSISRAHMPLNNPEEALVNAFKRSLFFTYGSLPYRIDVSDRDSSEMDRLRPYVGSMNPVDLIRRELVGELSAISYLGPLRTPPARHYIISGSDRQTVGSRGERMPQLLYRRRREIIPRLNDKLATFSIPYRLDISSAGNALTGDIIAISLRDEADVVVSPTDVGFGIGQLLPILVEGVVSSGKTICVEQPEIHLHPRLQAHLADFFIDTAKTRSEANRTGRSSGYGGNQWIVETHSESLILRLQTLIKRGTIPANFVSVLYVQPTDGNGSKVLRLRMDDDGDFLDDWPDGFFEESFQEIFLNRR